MAEDRPNDITDLLVRWRGGSREALDALTPLVYSELRGVARRQMRHERREITLEPTTLTHEAFIRLMGQRAVDWQNRAHFLALAAEIMRRILVEHARKRNAAKRGGGHAAISISDSVAGDNGPDVEVLDLHEAVSRLAEFDPRQARIVEMRYFGGLTVEETAEALAVSPATVKREWEVARLWLRREIRGEVPT